MKRYIAMLLAFVMVFSLAGCGKDKAKDSKPEEKSTAAAADEDTMKVGYILPAESGAPDTEAREDAIRKMQYSTGLADEQIIIKENIGKEQCEEAIKEEIKKGCTLIFACGARYEETVLALAAEHTDIQFCVEGGKESITSEYSNVHAYNSRIYEAYYAAGVIAGAQINYLLNRGDTVPPCTIGFVAYKECADTTSCINAFYLGVKEENSQCSIAVRYVGKRGDYDADAEAARQLVGQKVCFMVSYTYTTGVAAVCAENGIPVVGSQDNIINVAPKKAMTSTYTDWSVYYTEVVKDMVDGKEIPKDWCGGYAEDTVRLTQLNDAHIATGTTAKVIEVEQKLRKGKAKVFNLEKFTINGVSLDSLIKEGGDYKKYSKYVKNGQLKEQSLSSTPIFDDFIDGVSVSTENYIYESSEETEETEQ